MPTPPSVRFPEFGAVIAKYLGDENSDLPNFVKIASARQYGAGFLGPQYQAFCLDADGRLPTFSTSNIKPEIERRRHELRTFVEDVRGAKSIRPKQARMHREAYEAARRLQNVQSVFNVDDEWEKNRELYGDTAIGRRCMMARKLVEEGVPFVEVGQSSYDSHADNFIWHRSLVPPMEHAWAGLMADLEQRGLLGDTLIVWMGEIGRTPNINNRSGRDHYVRSWSTALAGCGVKGGLVYGASDENGADVKDNPVTEGDFFATIYQALGIDPLTEHYTGVRPIPIAPFVTRTKTLSLTGRPDETFAVGCEGCRTCPRGGLRGVLRVMAGPKEVTARIFRPARAATAITMCFPPMSKRSKVHPTNLPQTCGACHEDLNLTKSTRFSSIIRSRSTRARYTVARAMAASIWLPRVTTATRPMARRTRSCHRGFPILRLTI